MSRSILTALILFAGALPASAHTGHGAAYSILDGFQHPLGGLDHIAAMVAVGLWAGASGGMRTWAWPAVFVAMMAASAVAAQAGLALPFAEPIIAASLVVLGLTTLALVRAPVIAGGVLVGFFAIFHGFAHGAEAPAQNFAGYVAGFVAATALLHASGIAITRLADRLSGRLTVRALGGATTALGLALFVG